MKYNGFSIKTGDLKAIVQSFIPERIRKTILTQIKLMTNRDAVVESQ